MSDIKIDPDEGLFGRQSKQMTKTGKAKDKKKNRKRKRSRKDKQEEAQLESLLFGDVQDDDHPSHSSTALFAQVQQDFSNDEIIISPNRNDNASMYEYDSSAHSSSIVGLGGEELVDSDEDSDQDLLDLNDNKNNINNHSFGASAYDDVFGATDANDKENEVGDKAAWVDEDDENLRINISKENRLRKLRNDEGETVISGTELTKRLRDRFQSMNNKALDWAEIKGKGIHANTKKRKVHDSDDSDDSNSDSGSDSDSEVEGDTEFLYNTQSLTTSSDQLPAGKVDISRVKDANMAAPSQGVVTSVEFHQNGQLVMTAGMDKTVRLFQVDGLRNVKVQGVHLKDLPIYQVNLYTSQAFTLFLRVISWLKLYRHAKAVLCTILLYACTCM